MMSIKLPNGLCRYRLVLKLIEKMHFNNLLEIGIGKGIFLKKLADRGYRCKGIDISEEAISIASETLKPYRNTIVERADFFDIDDKFDLIIMLQVLEHIKDDLAALNKLKELLKKGGYLILSTPAHKNKWGYIDMVGGHYRRYDKEELSSLLKEVGFKIIYFWSYGFPIVNLFRPWDEFFYKRYFIKNNLEVKTLDERTRESDIIKVPWVMEYPKIFGLLFNEIAFYPLLMFQKLFLNTKLGLNYLILARKCWRK